MPDRPLSESERQLVVRCIMDAQHLLTVRNGGICVEAGVALAEADEATTHVMDDADIIHRLGLALAVLGWRPGDPTPPGTDEQLDVALRVGKPLED